MKFFLPLEQFELNVLISFYIFNFDFSYNTMSLYLNLILLFIFLFFYFGLKNALFIPTTLQTLIEYSLNQAIKTGFNKIIFIVSEITEKPFKEKFGNNYKGIPIEYFLQKFDKEKRDKPWGTCDAVCSTIEKIHEPFVIASGDDIFGEKTFEILANHLKNNKTNSVAVKKLIEMLPEKKTVNRGIFEVDDNNYVINGVEEININKENFIQRGFSENSPVSISIFGLHPETLKLLKEKLDEFKKQNSNDRKAECYLNIKLIKLIQERKIKMKLYYTPEKWFGITNQKDELIIKEQLKK